MRTLCSGVYDEQANDKGAISRFLSDTSANASDSILYLYERVNVRRCKISFLCNTLWVGENRKIERGRLQLNHASLALDTWVSKVPRQEPSDADNDSAVCDDSPAKTKTSDLSQLTTVLQRDIEGKSYLFSQCPPVLIPLLCSEI